MVYDADTYAKSFKIRGKYMCAKSIKRLAEAGNLPSHTIAHKLKGMWVFEVPDISLNIQKNFTILAKGKSRV